MRIIGDNSAGFANEREIRDALNSRIYDDINPNLRHFLDNMFYGYDLRGKWVHATTIPQRMKPDFYVTVDGVPQGKYVSVKMGSGNSLHQESFSGFIDFLISQDVPSNIIDDLRKWKTSKHRKPLILRGARQVGKTWILEEFGKEFEGGFVRINFDKNPEYAQFFETTKDVRRILKNLALATGQKITPETLVIFDEIQASTAALNSLKYFCEDAPEYYVASAGSLLGLTLSDGFPVGKVDFLDMGPLTFCEFLLACGDWNLVEYMENIDSIDKSPDAFANPLSEKLKMYLAVGGMPEPVRIWSEESDIAEVDRILSAILDSYESDFGKHAPDFDVPKIRRIWTSLPSQLARENKKFLYSAVKEGARAREYENALEWLKKCECCRMRSAHNEAGTPDECL